MGKIPLSKEEKLEFLLDTLHDIAKQAEEIRDLADVTLLQRAALKMCSKAKEVCDKFGWPRKPDVNIDIHIELASETGVEVLKRMLFPNRHAGEQIGPWAICIGDIPALCDCLLTAGKREFEIEAKATHPFQRDDVELFIKYIQDLADIKRIVISEDCIEKCVYDLWEADATKLKFTFLSSYDWPFDIPYYLSEEEKLDLVDIAYHEHPTEHNLQPLKGFVE